MQTSRCFKQGVCAQHGQIPASRARASMQMTFIQIRLTWQRPGSKMSQTSMQRAARSQSSMDFRDLATQKLSSRASNHSFAEGSPCQQSNQTLLNAKRGWAMPLPGRQRKRARKEPLVARLLPAPAWRDLHVTYARINCFLSLFHACIENPSHQKAILKPLARYEYVICLSWL